MPRLRREGRQTDAGIFPARLCINSKNLAKTSKDKPTAETTCASAKLRRAVENVEVQALLSQASDTEALQIRVSFVVEVLFILAA